MRYSTVYVIALLCFLTFEIGIISIGNNDNDEISEFNITSSGLELLQAGNSVETSINTVYTDSGSDSFVDTVTSEFTINAQGDGIVRIEIEYYRLVDSDWVFLSSDLEIRSVNISDLWVRNFVFRAPFDGDYKLIWDLTFEEFTDGNELYFDILYQYDGIFAERSQGSTALSLDKDFYQYPDSARVWAAIDFYGSAAGSINITIRYYNASGYYRIDNYLEEFESNGFYDFDFETTFNAPYFGDYSVVVNFTYAGVYNDNYIHNIGVLRIFDPAPLNWDSYIGYIDADGDGNGDSINSTAIIETYGPGTLIVNVSIELYSDIIMDYTPHEFYEQQYDISDTGFHNTTFNFIHNNRYAGKYFVKLNTYFDANSRGNTATFNSLFQYKDPSKFWHSSLELLDWSSSYCGNIIHTWVDIDYVGFGDLELIMELFYVDGENYDLVYGYNHSFYVSGSLSQSFEEYYESARYSDYLIKYTVILNGSMENEEWYLDNVCQFGDDTYNGYMFGTLTIKDNDADTWDDAYQIDLHVESYSVGNVDLEFNTYWYNENYWVLVNTYFYSEYNDGTGDVIFDITYESDLEFDGDFVVVVDLYNGLFRSVRRYSINNLCITDYCQNKFMEFDSESSQIDSDNDSFDDTIKADFTINTLNESGTVDYAIWVYERNGESLTEQYNYNNTLIMGSYSSVSINFTYSVLIEGDYRIVASFWFNGTYQGTEQLDYYGLSMYDDSPPIPTETPISSVTETHANETTSSQSPTSAELSSSSVNEPSSNLPDPLSINPIYSILFVFTMLLPLKKAKEKAKY